MIQLKRILVPADFSDYSRAALDYGCEFAARFGAELHLVHVLQDLVGLVPEPGLAFPPPGDYLLELERSAERALAALPGTPAPQGVRIERVIRHGPPFLEIIRYARESEIDLIVMGTHGRSGLAHMLLGSVAEKVVRKAPCPVLTIRARDLAFTPP